MEIANKTSLTATDKIGSLLNRIWRTEETSVALALLALFIIISILAPRFRTSYNLFSIMRQASLIGIVAMGQTIVLIGGGFDLSVGSVAGLAGILTGISTVKWGLPLPLSIIVGISAGIICGLFNGVLIGKVKISPLIVTLGSAWIFKGIILVMTRGYPILKFPSEFYFLGQGYLGAVPFPVILMLIIGFASQVFLSLTLLGRHIYAAGGNEQASYLSGIDPNRVKVIVYILSGVLASFAGIILAARLSSAQPSAGQNWVLPSFAIAVIGGAKLGGGRGRITGTILGAILIAVINNALVLVGVSPYWQDIVNGSIVIAAVVVSVVRERR